MGHCETYNTTVRKDHYGHWRATTQVEFDPDAKRVLEVYTGKNSRGDLYTSASVHKLEGNAKTHMVFQDFHKVMATVRVRCTEKAVRQQHEDVLSRLESVRQYARQHYRSELEGSDNG